MRLRGPRSYPKELYIRDSVWRVRFGKRLLNDDLAYTDPDKKTIWIRLNQEPFMYFRCLLHEIAHIIEDEYEIELPHRLVHQWEEAWTDFLIVNGSIAKRIFKL